MIESVRSDKEKPFPAQKSKNKDSFSQDIWEAMSMKVAAASPILSPKRIGEPESPGQAGPGGQTVPSGMPTSSRVFLASMCPPGVLFSWGSIASGVGGALQVKLG